LKATYPTYHPRTPIIAAVKILKGEPVNEGVEEQLGVVGADVLKKLETLVDCVDEVGLKPIQRPDGQPDAPLCCLSRRRFEACNRSAPLVRDARFGRGGALLTAAYMRPETNGLPNALVKSMRRSR
jgi:hypothetical protein